MVVHLNGTVICQCVGGSVAQGCLVIARQNNKIVYAILRNPEGSILTFAAQSGEVTYELLGFDLEQNGMFGMQAAVSQRTTTMGILLQDFGMCLLILLPVYMYVHPLNSINFTDNSAISEATTVPEDDGLICANCGIRCHWVCSYLART